MTSPSRGPQNADGRGFALACWLPLASLVGIETYVRGFEGWGAWSTAPLFLLPLGLSFVIGGTGTVRCVAELRAGSLRRSSLVFTAVALLPLVWLLIRRHVVGA